MTWKGSGISPKIKTARIRPAVEADQETIRQIVRAARINPLRLGWQAFLVAEHEGRIVGVGQIRRHRDGARELASLAVVPAYRRNGLGGAIVKRLLEGCAGPVYLYCVDRLAPYYAQFGFQVAEQGDLPPVLGRMYRLGRMGVRLMGKISRIEMSLVAMRWPGPDSDVG